MTNVPCRPCGWRIPFYSLCIGLTASTVALAQATVESLQTAPGEPAPAGFTVKGRASSDDVPHPAGTKRREMRKDGLEENVRAQALGQGSGKVHRIGRGKYKGRYVELQREKEDLIFTVLGQFGTQIHPALGGAPGPLHNQIPEPDRTVDNTTIWAPDFSRAHFENLLFSEETGAVSMRNFYIELSSNRYTVDGEVTDWVSLPYNANRYDDDATYNCTFAGVPGNFSCPGVWLFLRDSLNGWYDAQIAAGKTPEQINAELAKFDVWDRNDYDGDGNFDEPDGYIDHFQAVHAGMGEEVGGGAQGSAAIWSHRWFAFYNLDGVLGPEFNKAGGVRIGNSNYWVGDYTVEPENGGVGVFAHEFGHDLDLPDLYDGGGDNSTGFWTLMSAGSYGNAGTVDIGSKPVHMGAWEKLQLGWLNYEVAHAGKRSEHRLGPATYNTRNAQALVTMLPDNIIGPHEGNAFYYSGSGALLDTTMSRTVTLPAGSPTLTAQVQYDIEADWDYAYLVVVDGGTTNIVPTNLSTTANPNGQNFGQGITGSSSFEYVPLSADLSAFAGKTVEIGFWYWTDGFVNGKGLLIDDIQITGQLADGAEVAMPWVYSPAEGGFRVVQGDLGSFFNAYIAEFRQYKGYDKGLRTSPYVFGDLNSSQLQDWVTHFPYQDGLLISYWDARFEENNTSAHPGQGLILPIDAHPTPLVRPDDGIAWSSRYQTFDSTFGLERTDRLTLRRMGVNYEYRSQPGVPVFDDRLQYWRAETPSAGVKNPNTGTLIQVKSMSRDGQVMEVEVKPARRGHRNDWFWDRGRWRWWD